MKSDENLGIADTAIIEFDEELYKNFQKVDKNTLNEISFLVEKYIRQVNFDTWEKANEFYKRKFLKNQSN